MQYSGQSACIQHPPSKKRRVTAYGAMMLRIWYFFEGPDYRRKGGGVACRGHPTGELVGFQDRGSGTGFSVFLIAGNSVISRSVVQGFEQRGSLFLMGTVCFRA